MRTAPYDVMRDFAPISLIERTVNVLAVHPSLPLKSIKELIALAKARPGELYYSSGSIGGSQHLGTELLKSMAGINLVHVPYKGGALSVTAVIGGETHLMIAAAVSVLPHMKSGKLRALAVTSAEPSAVAPGLPTVAATVPGFEAVSMTGVFAPAKTPGAIINRLNQEIVRIMNSADAKEKLFNAGVEVIGSSPEQLAIAVNAETARWGKVIKDVGIKVD